MSFGSAEMPYVPRVMPMPHDLSHELRTPLAVIRMQAQLLLRAARRGAFTAGSGDRDRLVLGLQRIDDAVTRLSVVLNRTDIAAADERYPLPHQRDGLTSPDIH